MADLGQPPRRMNAALNARVLKFKRVQLRLLPISTSQGGSKTASTMHISFSTYAAELNSRLDNSFMSPVCRETARPYLFSKLKRQIPDVLKIIS